MVAHAIIATLERVFVLLIAAKWRWERVYVLVGLFACFTSVGNQIGVGFAITFDESIRVNETGTRMSSAGENEE